MPLAQTASFLRYIFTIMMSSGGNSYKRARDVWQKNGCVISR